MVLRFLGTLARVLIGFTFACLAAGIATVLFVDTPAEIATLPSVEMPERAAGAAELALLTATHAAIFAFAFALIAIGLAEWMKVRALPYYLSVGVGIALLGFFAQYQSEVAGQPTILNNYAVKAFLTSGFFAGLIYWLASGQFAGADRFGGIDDDEAVRRPSPKAADSVGGKPGSSMDQRARTLASNRLAETLIAKLDTRLDGERKAILSTTSVPTTRIVARRVEPLRLKQIEFTDRTKRSTRLDLDDAD